MNSPGTVRETTRWETVAVTALPPGWRNVYRTADGTLYEIPCPAILLQENCGTTTVWTERDGERLHHFDAAEPPYETRAVFADTDYGHLESAMGAGDYPATVGTDDYLGTVAPGQTAGDAADPGGNESQPEENAAP